MEKIRINLNDLATTFIGSVLLMAMCFEPEYQSKEQKEKLFWAYKKIGKNPKEYFKSVPETWDIEKILSVFGIKRTNDWQVCFVTSKFNGLLCPYLEKEGHIMPLTPRPDGLPVYTVTHAEDVRIIKWQ